MGLGDAVLRRSRGSLARRIDRIAPPGRILDVGAGDGSLLDALAVTGREALGLERHSNRSDVLSTDISELTSPWAAIVIWHTLEHLRKPGDTLRIAATLLAPGGALIVAVPNTESLQARIFGDHWFHLDLPRHLTHIPAQALLEVLRDSGLGVTRVSHLRGGQVLFGWLHGLVARTSGLDLYAAIRQPEARSAPLSSTRRATALLLGVLLTPVALIAAGLEVAMRRSGSIYVEATRE